MALAPRSARLSLRAKWTLVLLAIGALPIGALAYRTLAVQRAALLASERGLQIAVVDQVSDAIDRVLSDTEEATHRVGRLLTEARIVDEAARLELVRETVARAAVLSEVAIYAPDGTYIDAVARSGAVQLRPLPRIETGARKAGWLAPQLTDGAACLRYVEPVQRAGELRAWVVGTLTPSLLDRRIVELSQTAFNRPDRIVVIDAEHRVITSGGSPELPAGSSFVGKDASANDEALSAAMRQTIAITIENVGRGGEPMVSTARTITRDAWAVIVRRPQREAYAALGAARLALLEGALAFGVLAVLAAAFLAKRITQPVRQLMMLTRAYAKRDFAARSELRTGDELEDLGKAMSEMADDIARGEGEIARRVEVESNLSRYLPAEVARSIADGRGSIALGGGRRDVSVVFADVVAFTSFAEHASPERVVAFLNDLFTVLTEVIFRHGGTVDKFIGDCVMALFGAPNAQDDHAARALAAAEDMQRFVEASRALWRESYDFDARLGIGVHCGVALVGNLGSDKRMEYTVIGDVVNVAARLEGLARPGQTLVTGEVRAAAGGAFAFGSLGEHPIRGKSQAIEVFELQ